jgi:hypothetical protein
MQWFIQSQMRHIAQQMRGRDLFSPPAGMLNRRFSTFEAIRNPNKSYYE